MSISKKFYSFVLALIAVFALIGCGQQVTPPEQPEPIDGITLSDAQALVNKAMDKIGWTEQDLTVVGDLTFATSNSFAPGVTISWESDNTEVIALDGKVTRPVYGQGNATVVVTATYSISYNLDDEGNVVDEVYSATESWTFTVVEAGEVFNLAKLEAQLVAGEIATGTEVTFTGVIVAKMASNQGNQIFVHDGSAGIYVFTASDLTVGTEVQVSGTADIYYEIFQVKNAGITVVSENATLPEAQKTTLGAHMALGKDSGKIGGELINVDVLLEIVTEQYTNVYITDPKTGDKARIYYKTEYTYIPGYNNETDYIAALQPYNGKTINITLVQYDIKDGEGHRLMLTSYPITEVQAQELTDDEKAQFILNGVSLEDSYLKTFTLPTADGLTWAVKEGTGIEIVDGQAVVTRAEADQTVVLTATATVNEAVATKDFTVVIPLVEATVEGVVELTLSSLELASNSYASSTATVNGVTIQFVELGNYAAGIQMRNKEADGGNRSQIWNTVAFSGAIEKIEMVYNSTKKTYDNANCMIYSFGTEAGSLTHTVNFSTVAGQTTYTVTPGGAFTFFKLEINPSYTYSMYWDSITIYLGEGSDAPVEPEVPTHTHVACPTCGLCTAEDCDGAAEVKCQGHEVVTPEATWQVVANFEAGVAYKLGFYQTQKAATYYATGAMSGYYGATTTVAEEAADAYLVVVEGGYLIKVVAGSDVKYVAYQVSGTHHNFVYVTDEASASVFTYDAELATFVTTDGTNTVFMGTYGSYNTFGMSLVSKASTSYCANLYALVENNDTPVEPEVPAHEHVACPTCGLCTAEDCDGAAEVKCQGHEVVTPEPTWQVVANFEAGVAYKLGFYQTQKAATYYATGAMSGYYGATTTVAEDAADAYLVVVEGGYLIKVVAGSDVKYVAYQVSGTHHNFVYVTDEASASVFTYDAELATFVTTDGTNTVFMGTYGSYNTFGMSLVSKASTSYCANLYALVGGTETPDTPVEPEVPAHEHVACPTCGLCTAEDCDGEESVKCQGHEVVEPETPVVSGGKDDFNTVAHNSSYLDRTTTAGWTATFAAVNAGAVNPETNANPVFGFLGDENTRAFTIAGGTDKIGTIKSPLLSGGLSKLTFKYTNLFTDTKISVTLNIKDAAGNVLATEVFGYDNPDKAKYEIRLAEYTFAVEGEFVIEFVNNCPNGIVGNKDRATIWNIEWVGAAASETPDTPVEPEVPAHEHVACPTCGLCTAADCDGAAEVKCAGHVVEPEVPAHEHVACPTCQLCTAEDCDGEESVKCQGHEVVEPETPVVPAEITITFEGENRTEFSADKQVWSVDGLTITNAKAASTQPIADYVNPARFYANTSLTFESTANITKIVFTTTGGKNFSASQTVEGATINVDGTTTTITLDTPATSFTIAKIAAQVRVSQIVVYTE